MTQAPIADEPSAPPQPASDAMMWDAFWKNLRTLRAEGLALEQGIKRASMSQTVPSELMDRALAVRIHRIKLVELQRDLLRFTEELCFRAP